MMDPAVQEIVVWAVLTAAVVGLGIRFRRKRTTCTKCQHRSEPVQVGDPSPRRHLRVFQDRA